MDKPGYGTESHIDRKALSVIVPPGKREDEAMHLDTVEVHRISERLGDLDIHGKMLASFITVRAPDAKICSEMGFRPHQLEPSIKKLCTELHMTHLEHWNWRDYIRAAVLLVASDPSPAPPPKPKKFKVSRKTLQEAEPFIAGFVKAGKKTSDPILAHMYLSVPNLFAYAISLCGSGTHAEELVQEGIVRAYASLSTFQTGSDVKANVKAWLFTIVKNCYLTARRKQKLEVADPDGVHAGALSIPPDQIDSLEVREIEAALDELPCEQREAVWLVSLGYSYEEVAACKECAVGTIKSRVNRARVRLAALVEREESVAEDAEAAE